MKQRFGLMRRPWDMFYAEDNVTGNSKSLGTRNRQEAQRLLHARNESHAQSMLNVQMARAYLSATDPAAANRTWQAVICLKCSMTRKAH